jgi:hypothetical protein
VGQSKPPRDTSIQVNQQRQGSRNPDPDAGDWAIAEQVPWPQQIPLQRTQDGSPLVNMLAGRTQRLRDWEDDVFSMNEVLRNPALWGAVFPGAKAGDPLPPDELRKSLVQLIVDRITKE